MKRVLGPGRVTPVLSLSEQLKDQSGHSASIRKSVKIALLDHLIDKLPIQVNGLSDLGLYYIRGVSEFDLDGAKVRTVIYDPEFLYTADIGRENLVGFRVPYSLPDVDPRVIVLGDPDFPRLEEIELVSIPSQSDRDLLYFHTPGSFIVRFADDIGLDEATNLLDGYLEEVEELVPSLNIFKGAGGFFCERAHQKEIEAKVNNIRYVQLNHINRIIDFSPGWLVDQIL